MALAQPDQIFVVTGDSDLAFFTCRHGPDWDVLYAAVLDGLRAPTDFRLNVVPGVPDAAAQVLTECLDLTPGALLMAEQAIAALAPMLSGAGYFIPVDFEVERHYRFFVCDHKVNALDEERSEIKRFEDGDIWTVFRPDFHGERLAGADIFKVAGLRGDLFVSDRFKAAVEQHGFLGFEFRKVWDATTGGVRYDPSQHWFEASLTEKQRIAAKRRAARAALAARSAH